LENMVKILLLIFILIMLYGTIKYNSDVAITFRTVFSLLHADLREVAIEVWTCLKSALFRVSTVITMVKILELFVVCTFIICLPEVIPGRWFQPPDPAGTPTGKMRESHRILQENTGNCPHFFRWIPVNFLCFSVEADRRSSEKFRKFLAGILLPQNHRNYPELVVSGPDYSTWDELIHQSSNEIRETLIDVFYLKLLSKNWCILFFWTLCKIHHLFDSNNRKKIVTFMK
jgi:hypothetical protein